MPLEASPTRTPLEAAAGRLEIGARAHGAWETLATWTGQPGPRLVDLALMRRWRTSHERELASARLRLVTRDRRPITQFVIALDVVEQLATGDTQDTVAARYDFTRQRVSYHVRRVGQLTGIDVSASITNAFAHARDDAERADVRQVRAAIIAQPGLTIAELCAASGVDVAGARRAAGALQRFIARRGNPTPRRVTDERCLAALRLARQVLGPDTPLTQQRYATLLQGSQVAGPGLSTICHRFGNWSRALEAAGAGHGGTLPRDTYRHLTPEAAQAAVVQFILEDAGTTAAEYSRWAGGGAERPAVATIVWRGGRTWVDAYNCALERFRPGADHRDAFLTVVDPLGRNHT